jgi:hypothetical protein
LIDGGLGFRGPPGQEVREQQFADDQSDDRRRTGGCETHHPESASSHDPTFYDPRVSQVMPKARGFDHNRDTVRCRSTQFASSGGVVMISRIRRQARSLVVSGRPWLLGFGVLGFLALLVACDGDPQSTMALILLMLIWMLDFGWYKGAAVVPVSAPVAAPVAHAQESLYLGAAAHVPGAAGTNWRTDCELLCIGADDCTVTIESLVHGLDNSVPHARTFEVPAGHCPADRRHHRDGVRTGRQGRAAGDAHRGAILATNRTYNLLGAGNDLDLPAGATFGQSIPAVRSRDAIAFGQQARLVQLAHGEAAGFRTNVGLVNLVARTTVVTIDLHASDGTLLGTVNRTLKPFEYRQVGGIFGLVTSDDVVAGHAVVRTTTEDAGSWPRRPSWTTPPVTPSSCRRGASLAALPRRPSRRGSFRRRPTSGALRTPIGGPMWSFTTPATNPRK